MDNKLRQVTDTIHGTIYLSRFESELISTPYFYRLHDVYQSSTVYLTYPSNRTKRYEHSLGTMQLASEMFFSAVSNSDVDSTRKDLFSYLKENLTKIIMVAKTVTSMDRVPSRYIKCGQYLEELLENCTSDAEVFNETILESSLKEFFKLDSEALEQFQYYPPGEKWDISQKEIVFLYRTLLEAIRIVALFHDVGHPPYSHVIEDALNKLKNEIEESGNQFNEEKKTKFKSCMDTVLEKDTENTLLGEIKLREMETHEKIGVSFLCDAISDVLPNMLEIIKKSKMLDSAKVGMTVYYIAVVEFSICILLEKDEFFESMHKIVDGIVDADRMDYVVRDSLNSGVDWGRIPYQRIIKACKFEREGEGRSFVIAFPSKVSDDISDFLLLRYKVFARINFHHRCMRTAAVLKSCVLKLSRDYLLTDRKSKNAKCICEDISLLWTALEKGAGSSYRVIQWNDSWLVSTLHKALVTLRTQSQDESNRFRLSDREQKELLSDLEEFLLNRKKYYTLIKRGSDIRELAVRILGKSDLLPAQRMKIREVEENKLKRLKPARDVCKDVYENEKNPTVFGMNPACLFSEEGDAYDSLHRMDILDSNPCIESLEMCYPFLDKTYYQVIEDALREMESNHVILGYQLIENIKGKHKIGVTEGDDKWDCIYLFSKPPNRIHRFEIGRDLLPQLQALTRSVPEIYIYINPPKDEDIGNLSKVVLDRITELLSEEIKKRHKTMFKIGISEERDKDVPD